eukprot:TRINITY_DN1528_c0_g5_i1.p1 TRINITY_DN1528_c0_g5~~TRINITY_DN1528_c0_g5_i1.p1  ORF type:complete len:1047 (+),score=290.34 TRINITY_DN1528_c0_g5_i1:79-3219(+)
MANRQQLYDQYMRGDDLGIDVDLFASSSSPPPPVARPPSAPKPPLPPSARGGAQQPPHRPPMPAMPTPSSTPAPPPFTMPQYDDPVLAVPPPPPPSHPAAGQSPPPPAAVASHSHPHAHAHAHPPPTPQEGLLNSSPLAVASPAPPQGVAHGEVTALRQQLAAEVQKVQNQNRMLRAQEEELVAAEAAAEALRSENAALRRDVAALQQQSHNAPAELAALKAEHETLRQNFEEAGLLTEQAGDLLKKVQGDVDDAAHAALTVLKRLFPDEQGPPAYEAVSELITYLGAQVEGLLGETLDTAAGLDAELNKAKAQVHGLAGEVDAARGSRTAVTSLGKELANLRAENDELRQNTASRDGAAAGRVRELEEQLRNAERLHSEHEREKQTVVELLQATESALRSLEGDYRKLKETAAAPSSEPLSVRHGMLWKYGIGSSGGASSWKERFFAADATCLQYYLSEDDYRRNDPSLMKGKRYYAAQQSFVHRFVSHASHLASCPVVGTTSIHPVATDPDAFYFGFVPKSDNELSTQAFVLRTSSKEAWQEWCQVLSHAFNGAHAPPVSAGTPDGAGAASPELLTALTPPTRSERRIMESEAFQGTRNDLGKELRKTEGALRALVEEQQPLKQRLLELEAEAEGLTKELDRATRDLQVQGMKIEVYRREAGRAAEELAELKVTNRTLSEAMGASGEEILVLRREIDDVRTRESRSLTAAAAHRQQLQAQMPPVVACAGAQTDLAGIETALEDDRRGDLSASMLSGAKAPRVAHSSAPGRRSAEDQCKELEDKLCAMTDEQHQASKKLQEQEAAHDAQIAAFCEQVLQDMDAIRLQSKVEVARREEDWQKEVAIWQQLVAEKEQQIAMTAHTVATNRPRPSPLDQEEDVTLSRDDVQWKIIGGQERASNTVLCLKLSASGEITAEPDAPKTFATKIAADRRMLSQLSVLDNPPSANALSRTWRFKSLGVDASSISLTLSITPHASHPPDLLSDLPPTSRALAAPDKRTRRFPATGAAAGLRSSSASVRSSFSHSTSPYRGRGKSRGRHTRVFVP